jgi:hypothetical protein
MNDLSFELVTSESLKTLVGMKLQFVNQVVDLSIDEGNLFVMNDDEAGEPIRLATPTECEEMQTALLHLQLAMQNAIENATIESDDE